MGQPPYKGQKEFCNSNTHTLGNIATCDGGRGIAGAQTGVGSREGVTESSIDCINEQHF